MRLVIGLLAHVDAGKTTLSEHLLYSNGSLRKQGRVDHGNTFLDTHDLERERGITIFSKTARLSYKDTEIILVDTPGHVDFSAEMERTLKVLDAAILLISASDGIGPYTKTLFNLLEKNNVPTFVFVNKMDLGNIARDDFAAVLLCKLSEKCIAFDAGTDAVAEDIALFDERIMESYLESGQLTDENIRYLVSNRMVVPCYFGSALKGTGTGLMLEDICRYCSNIPFLKEFAARVYKINCDRERITFMRIMGGSLRARDVITYNDGTEEKITQLRLYSGDKYNSVDEVFAGDICGVLGLTKTEAGTVFGEAEDMETDSVASVISYRVIPIGCDINRLYNALKQMYEEDPALDLKYIREKETVSVCLMGDVQMQIVSAVLKSRFGIDAEFDLGEVVYRETIRNRVVGIGHFEPLRHYAEVHLVIEPAPKGSGIHYSSICSTDILSLPYQKQILNALEQDTPKGVLTGAFLTDVDVKLISGRAHEKHTEGGDLRQAALRALRQGLMKAESILLEPYEEFRISVPSKYIGRLMTDLKRLSAAYSEPDLVGDFSVLSGRGPVATLTGYKKEVYSYTGGEADWQGNVCGYYECHNSEDIVNACGYDPVADLSNSPDSVFCARGAGFNVNWSEVDARAHISPDSYAQLLGIDRKIRQQSVNIKRQTSSDEELDAIFERTFGRSKRERYPYRPSRVISSGSENEAVKEYKQNKKKPPGQITVIDGYNVIYDWKELRSLADQNIDSARDAMLDRLANYTGYTKKEIIIVFDAYRTPNPNSMEYVYNDMKIVFTARNESADLYIEKLAAEFAGKKTMTVVTSDGLEQIHVFSQGALRMSSREFLSEVERIEAEIRHKIN